MQIYHLAMLHFNILYFNLYFLSITIKTTTYYFWPNKYSNLDSLKNAQLLTTILMYLYSI